MGQKKVSVLYSEISLFQGLKTVLGGKIGCPHFGERGSTQFTMFPICLSRLEDGTIPFLEILALEHGFQTLSKLAGPMSGIADRTFTLAK